MFEGAGQMSGGLGSNTAHEKKTNLTVDFRRLEYVTLLSFILLNTKKKTPFVCWIEGEKEPEVSDLLRGVRPPHRLGHLVIDAL